VIYSSSPFSRFAKWTARATGHPAAFMAAALIIVIWGVTGPIFKFSDTWQLVINTGTTIVTFLMVFLIQNTQNRDSHAVQLKLDELIRAVSGAHNALLDLEGLEEADLERFRGRYEELARTAREALRRGDWIPAPRKSGRIRSHRFVNGRSLIKFDLLVERFDVIDGTFILVPP
jgi:low affinity Fe/Cu permease